MLTMANTLGKGNTLPKGKNVKYTTQSNTAVKQ